MTLVTWVPDEEFCAMDNVECVRVGADLSILLESKDFFTGNLSIFGENSSELQQWHHLSLSNYRVAESCSEKLKLSTEVHKAAYSDPILSVHIKERTRFDAMISLWMLDFGPYLAHKVFEAPLIYLQVS